MSSIVEVIEKMSPAGFTCQCGERVRKYERAVFVTKEGKPVKGTRRCPWCRDALLEEYKQELEEALEEKKRQVEEMRAFGEVLKDLLG
jgi:uncharacterized protein with PIN domain